jgi:alkanesulfonate monooxygenase SsuD/methylene tetrahydromethanopterin reductase-like flavin-dependent oxidoreductase (luciferase family)
MLPSFSFARDYPTVARLRDFATRAEAMGFAGLWVAEHLLSASSTARPGYRRSRPWRSRPAARD